MAFSCLVLGASSFEGDAVSDPSASRGQPLAQFPAHDNGVPCAARPKISSPVCRENLFPHSPPFSNALLNWEGLRT